MELFAASLRPARICPRTSWNSSPCGPTSIRRPRSGLPSNSRRHARREIAKCRSPYRIWHTCCPLSLSSITTPSASSTKRVPGFPLKRRRTCAQLDELTAIDFLVDTPWRWLTNCPRYFQAIPLRIERLRSGGGYRDDLAMQELEPHLARYHDRRRTHEAQRFFDAELEEFRWMIEEFRVSLFTQQLGTSMKISSQRLDRQWAKVK